MEVQKSDFRQNLVSGQDKPVISCLVVDKLEIDEYDFSVCDADEPKPRIPKAFKYYEQPYVSEYLKEQRKSNLREQLHNFVNKHLDDITQLTDGRLHNLTFSVQCESQSLSSESNASFIK